MKLKSLLVLGASMFMSVAANAEWTKPVVQTQDFVTDGTTEQYIYNVETGRFILGANDWNTRSSVGDKGYRFKITPTGDGTYSLTDYVETQKAWKKMFADSPTGIWVDNNNGANADSWTLTLLDGSDNLYQIGNLAFEGEMLGTDLSGNDTRNYLSSYFADNGIEAGYTWTSVSIEAYNAFFPEMERYESAVKLGEALADIDATYPAVDVADEKAVYDNEESTKEQLDAATASVVEKKAKAIATEAEASATYANPIDMTGSIINPTFDKISDFTGWSGSGFGAGGTTSTCAERYEMIFNTWQEMKNMPKGVYKVNVDGFYRAGSTAADFAATKANTENNAMVYGSNMVEGAEADVATSPIMHLFAGIEPGEHFDLDGNSLGGTKLEDGENVYYVANSMKDFTNYNGTTATVEKPYYKTNAVMFPVSEGTLRIGVKKDVKIGTDWVIVDNFGLTYYGNGADAWGALMDDTKKNQALDASLIVSKSVKESFEATVNAAAATDYASYAASVAAIEEAKAAAEENAKAWAAYKELVDQSNTMINDPKYTNIPEAWALGTGVTTANKNIAALELTTEQVIAATAELQKLYDATSQATPEGTDVTDKFLKNTDFSAGWANWQHTGTGGNFVANSTTKCAEAWNVTNFDVYQEVANAPAGIYEIQVQGFYRHGNAGDAGWLECYDEDGTQKDESEWPKSTAFVYMNDAQSPLQNVYGVQIENNTLYKTEGLAGPAPYVDPNGVNWFANDMTNGGIAFDNKYYISTAYSLVAKKGDPLRIGVKGTTANQDWAIFTRFRLVYQGFKAELIQAELEKLLPELEAALFEGTPMGADVYLEAEELLANAGDAMESGDGKAMFDLLAQVYPLITKINDSKAIFAQLPNKAVEVEDAMGQYEETAFEEAMNNAGEIYGLLDEMGSTQTEATDQDALDLMKRADEAIKQLAIPSFIAEASPLNPVDMTGFIINPSFETGNTNGWEQLSGEGVQQFGAQDNDAFGKDGSYYAERWHAAGKLDMNQVLSGLPCGTYLITVDGHASEGIGAVLYANEKEAEFTNHDDAKVPNTEQIAIYIEEGQDITIGAKGTLTADTWFALDNFTLTCVGYNEDTTSFYEDGVKGDVNGDGVVNGGDAIKVYEIVEAGEFTKAADVNNDGAVNGGDAIKVYEIIEASTQE